MKEAASAIGNFSQEQISNFEKTGSIEIKLKTGSFNIGLNEVEINSGRYTGLERCFQRKS